jgi:hypothetical protein
MQQSKRQYGQKERYIEVRCFCSYDGFFGEHMRVSPPVPRLRPAAIGMNGTAMPGDDQHTCFGEAARSSTPTPHFVRCCSCSKNMLPAEGAKEEEKKGKQVRLESLTRKSLERDPHSSECECDATDDKGTLLNRTQALRASHAVCFCHSCFLQRLLGGASRRRATSHSTFPVDSFASRGCTR